MSDRPHNYGFFLLTSLGGAFVTAFAFMATLYYSLPPGDLAYGQGLFVAMGNPFVLSVALSVAALSGLAASPLLFFALRHSQLHRSLPIVFISVLVTVLILTPFSTLAGWGGAYVALILSTLLNKPSPRPAS